MEGQIETVVSAGVVATAFLELLKWVLRKFVFKDMSYDFPKWAYVIGVPTVSALVVPLLALIGFEGYVMPTDWVMFVQNVVMVLVASAVSLVSYGGVKSLKAYRPS